MNIPTRTSSLGFKEKSSNRSVTPRKSKLKKVGLLSRKKSSENLNPHGGNLMLDRVTKKGRASSSVSNQICAEVGIEHAQFGTYVGSSMLPSAQEEDLASSGSKAARTSQTDLAGVVPNTVVSDVPSTLTQQLQTMQSYHVSVGSEEPELMAENFSLAPSLQAMQLEPLLGVRVCHQSERGNGQPESSAGFSASSNRSTIIGGDLFLEDVIQEEVPVNAFGRSDPLMYDTSLYKGKGRAIENQEVGAGATVESHVSRDVLNQDTNISGLEGLERNRSEGALTEDTNTNGFLRRLSVISEEESEAIEVIHKDASSTDTLDLQKSLFEDQIIVFTSAGRHVAAGQGEVSPGELPGHPGTESIPQSWTDGIEPHRLRLPPPFDGPGDIGNNSESEKSVTFGLPSRVGTPITLKPKSGRVPTPGPAPVKRKLDVKIVSVNNQFLRRTDKAALEAHLEAAILAKEVRNGASAEEVKIDSSILESGEVRQMLVSMDRQRREAEANALNKGRTNFVELVSAKLGERNQDSSTEHE